MRHILLATAFVLLLCASAFTQAPKIGVGAFGGINIPIAQDDQKSGTAFGFRARVQALPFITVEPNIMFSKWGAPDPVDGTTLGIDGSKITAFGVDATLGGSLSKLGLKPFFTVGIGSFKVKNDDTGYDESNFGFKGGLGLAFGVTPKFDVDVRANALVIPQSDGGSKKGALITGGLTYNL